MKKIGLLGCGSWGTTLAQILAKKGENVFAWHYRKDFIDSISLSRVNPLLPTIDLDEKISFHHNINDVICGSEILILSVPSSAMRETLEKISKNIHPEIKIVNTSKGFELNTLMSMSEIILEILNIDQDQIITLYGPSHSEEVIKNLPTAMVSACTNESNSKIIQSLFSTENLRIYTSKDIRGVEIGGSLKNVIAIASGICNGIGYGDNANAALITRGLHEITKLGIAMGAKEQTFYGLSGIGDLIATCLSKHSRNRHVGDEISKGKDLEEIISSMGMVAEGVNTTKVVHQLSNKFEIEMPISNSVYEVLFMKRNPKISVKDLMIRKLKKESIQD